MVSNELAAAKLAISPTEMRYPLKASRGPDPLFCMFLSSTSPFCPCLPPTPVCDRRTDTWLCRVYTPLMTPTPSSTPAPHASSLSTTAITATLRRRLPRARYGTASVSHDYTLHQFGRQHKNQLVVDVVKLCIYFRTEWYA